MSKQLSFVKNENELIHDFRNRINRAENIEDVRNIFSYTIIELLGKIFDDKIGKISMEDVVFKPKEKLHYKFNEKISNNPEFNKTLEESDLSKVISDFADSAYRRYLHLEKHPEKSEMKIRNF